VQSRSLEETSSPDFDHEPSIKKPRLREHVHSSGTGEGSKDATSSRKVAVIGTTSSRSRGSRGQQKLQDEGNQTINRSRLTGVNLGKREPSKDTRDKHRNSSNNSNDDELEPALQVG
jgi:hypothetical protein